MIKHRALVTGAAGFIGRPLVRRLLDRGYDVAALDNRRSGLEQMSDLARTGHLRVDKCDITDQSHVAHVIRRESPSALIHLAAHHYIPFCEGNPRETVHVNLHGLSNILSALDHTHGTPHVVLFASSADVYAPSDGPMAEDDQTQPSSVYGATKLLGERLMLEWARARRGRRIINGRLFNVYGPGDRTPHLIPHILDGVRTGGPIMLGTLAPKRDYIYIDDVVALLCALIEMPKSPQVLNLGTGQASSVAEVVEAVGAVIGHPLTARVDAQRARPTDRVHLQADTARLKAMFPDFRPYSLRSGLTDMLRPLNAHRL